MKMIDQKHFLTYIFLIFNFANNILQSFKHFVPILHLLSFLLPLFLKVLYDHKWKASQKS